MTLKEQLVVIYECLQYRGNSKSPKLDLDIDIPVKLLQTAIKESYERINTPLLIDLEGAEAIIQLFLYVRADGLAYTEYSDDPLFWEKYGDSVDLIKEWMIVRSRIDENYNLDNGEPKSPQSNLGQVADANANMQGPGGGHPDDTVDTSTLQTQGEVSSSDLMRLALKKDKNNNLFLWELKNKLNEFRTLSPDMNSLIREQKKKELINYYRVNVSTPEFMEGFKAGNQKLVEDLKAAADIAILQNGFSRGTVTLFAKFKEPTFKLARDFTVNILKDRKVLVIPSGALYGMENSAFFKASLDEFVKQGGTLVVFAQQYGYEFNILPVPQEADGTYKQITGYGWEEDQNCFTNAVSIDTWHQILSGQNRSTPTLNVDGYFTGYPSNSTIILKRTANGQPALLMYEYGAGRVIVTSMYSDWAYGHGQASSEEVALVRDIISWAKSPATLPEVKLGQAVSVQMEVKSAKDRTNDFYKTGGLL